MIFSTHKHKSDTLTIGEVMVSNPITIKCSNHLITAKKLMNKHGVRHLPVVDGDTVVGIVSERDLNLTGAFYGHSSLKERTVDELCLFEPFVVSEHSNLKAVVQHMVEKKIGSAIVADKGKVRGIFTMVDVAKLLKSYI